jgi:hypothetical protein
VAKQTTDAALAAENEELREMMRTLQIFAKRYADGRSTYAATQVNEITRRLLEMGVVLNSGGEGTVWAKDGGGRGFDGLDDEHLTPGHPVATGELLGMKPGSRLAGEFVKELGLKGGGIYEAVAAIKRLKAEAAAAKKKGAKPHG